MTILTTYARSYNNRMAILFRSYERRMTASFWSYENQLTTKKAKILHILYSNMDWIASGHPTGTHNFYVNGGVAVQPGCENTKGVFQTCHHWYSADMINYYTIRGSKSNRCFTRIWCNEWNADFPASSDGMNAINEVIIFSNR